MQQAIGPHRTTLLTVVIFGMQQLVLGGWFAMILFVNASHGLPKTVLVLTLASLSSGSVLASAYAEFVLIGSGTSAVASLDDRFEARNVALMLMPAICGYLIGPPLIGILGDGFR